LEDYIDPSIFLADQIQREHVLVDAAVFTVIGPEKSAVGVVALRYGTRDMRCFLVVQE
jgi:hypothetical protein